VEAEMKMKPWLKLEKKQKKIYDTTGFFLDSQLT
jgi:hypothetical protein